MVFIAYLFNCFRMEKTSIFMDRGNPMEKKSRKNKAYNLVKAIKRQGEKIKLYIEIDF